jgi:hypothetical protein
MEHGPFEPQRLREFMQGLVDGGPTKSGHRTPTVIVTLPFIGLDGASVRANPNGELILSVKMEDKYSLENVDEITSVPGIAWGEWGPGDQAMSLMGLDYLKKGGSDEAHAGTGGFTPEGLPRIGEPKLDAARARIMAAMKAHHILPLHSASINNLEQLIKAGVMVTHGTSIELTNQGARSQSGKCRISQSAFPKVEAAWRTLHSAHIS